MRYDETYPRLDDRTQPREDSPMPNVHLTKLMLDYMDEQIGSGAYANLSEVVRAGLRLLMEREGAQQFFALRAELEAAADVAEAGAFAEFDPRLYEPRAYPP